MIVVDFGCYAGKIHHDHGNPDGESGRRRTRSVASATLLELIKD
jgi:hypothetical protein